MRLNPVERLIAQQSRQAPGIGGRSANEAPVRPRPRGDVVQRGVGAEPLFDFPGPLVVATSGVYDARGDEDWTLLVGRLVAVATTDTVAQLVVNSTPVETLTIPAGDDRADTTISPTLAAGDAVQVTVSTPGTGGVGLTVQPRAV